jgi:hypothetical protein
MILMQEWLVQIVWGLLIFSHKNDATFVAEEPREGNMAFVRKAEDYAGCT